MRLYVQCCSLRILSMTKRRTIARTMYRLNFHSVVAAWTLVVYLSSAVLIDLVHHSFHEHVALEVHDDLVENDPCHRAIHHQDKKSGCHHNSHLKSDEKKCTLSPSVFKSHHLLATIEAISFEHKNQVYLSAYRVPHFRIDFTYSFLRGPPSN